MTYPLRPLSIPLWRMIHPQRHRTPFSGEGARLFGGRWNKKGLAALYLSADPVTAISEYYQGFAKPGTLVPYTIEASHIADLTDDDPRIAEALTCQWSRIARSDDMPSSWVLAQELVAAGAQGALVPSIQHRGGRNIVLWRWHDATADGEGAALRLLDPDAVLNQR